MPAIRTMAGKYEPGSAGTALPARLPQPMA